MNQYWLLYSLGNPATRLLPHNKWSFVGNEMIRVVLCSHYTMVFMWLVGCDGWIWIQSCCAVAAVRDGADAL